MNHTKNYNLPQWELNDLIRMEDFNSAMSNIENGIDGVKAAAEARDTELERKVNAADVKASAKPYATGAYTGNGAEVREINLGFSPAFVIICSDQLTHTLEFAGIGMAMAGPGVNSRHIYLTGQGFRLENKDSINRHPIVNEYGKVYNYIAFR